MQQIERYGVIALVFLLVTIVAISFWGDSKSPGFWSRLMGRDKKAEVVKVDPPVQLAERVAQGGAPLSPNGSQQLPATTPSSGAGANVPTPTDMPASGHATIGAPLETPANIAQNTPPAGLGVQSQHGAMAPLVPSTPSTVEAPKNVALESEYVVQKGDSLARIAKRKLGQESRWTEIQALNKGLDPQSLAVGMKLKLPTGASAPETTPQKQAGAPLVAKNTEKPKATEKEKTKKSSGASYTVRAGDRLTSIAERELGDAKRWRDIVAANPGIDANRLAVGQKLSLPGAEKAPVTVAALNDRNDQKKPRVR